MIKSEAIRLPFNYAAGAVGTAYLAGLSEGRLLASRCEPCARVLSPARSLCPFCGYSTGYSAQAQLSEVGPSGVVESWTTMSDGSTFVLVQLDGADTAMLHRFVRRSDNCAIGQSAGEHEASGRPVIGDRVVAVFGSEGLLGFEVAQP